MFWPTHLKKISATDREKRFVWTLTRMARQVTLFRCHHCLDSLPEEYITILLVYCLRKKKGKRKKKKIIELQGRDDILIFQEYHIQESNMASVFVDWVHNFIWKRSICQWYNIKHNMAICRINRICKSYEYNQYLKCPSYGI